MVNIDSTSADIQWATSDEGNKAIEPRQLDQSDKIYSKINWSI